MSDIYFDGVRLGAIQEVNISNLSKEEARALYMDRYDVLLDSSPQVVEKVEVETLSPMGSTGFTIGF